MLTPPPLIDTHVHLNFADFQADLAAVAAAWRSVGVVQLVHSCVTPAEFGAIQALADLFPELHFAVGLHPLDADQWTAEMAAEIAQLAQSDRRVVAIGETGLDFFKADNEALQRQVFRAQMQVAQALQLPLIIHCRDAAQALVTEIRQFNQNQSHPVRGVMHCWAGTPEETAWFLDLGFYISFSGIVTFKNAVQIKESAQLVPSDRLLIETDCPFLTPEPKRKERRNQPANVLHVAECLAALRQESLAQLAAQTTQNARDLFGLGVPAESAIDPG